jgi:uncharacterized protein
MHESLNSLAHRQWPLPTGNWRWQQSWLDLAFIHYRVAIADLRSLVPAQLTIEECDGTAWVSLVPFRMAGVRRRPFPCLPGMGEFLELNLRTYVSFRGQPGVWFFSLEAESLPIVMGGRMVYHVPYHWARLSCTRHQDVVNWTSQRRLGRGACQLSYRIGRDPVAAPPGSLIHWLTERYFLYAGTASRLWQVPVHHAPWELRTGELLAHDGNLLALAGIAADLSEPLLQYSPGVHAISWAAERL